MDPLIDARRNWALAEKHRGEETDARRRQMLGTLIAHGKAEAAADFMGISVPDPATLYLYRQRLLIVWEFDADGLVLCEDSYGAAAA